MSRPSPRAQALEMVVVQHLRVVGTGRTLAWIMRSLSKQLRDLYPDKTPREIKYKVQRALRRLRTFKQVAYSPAYGWESVPSEHMMYPITEEIEVIVFTRNSERVVDRWEVPVGEPMPSVYTKPEFYFAGFDKAGKAVVEEREISYRRMPNGAYEEIV